MLYSSQFNEAYIQELAKLGTHINPVEIVTPENVSDIKECWTRSVSSYGFFYSPPLRYDKDYLKEIASYSSRLQRIRAHISDEVKALDEIDKVILDLLLKRLNQSIAACEMAASIYLGDDKHTSDLSQFIYGAVPSTQILDCYDIINEPTSHQGAIEPKLNRSTRKKLKSKVFYADKIGYWFQQALDEYGLSNWTIETSNRYPSIDVRIKNSAGKPIIGIPITRTVNGLELLALIGHEVGCHVRSVENAMHLMREILGDDSPLLPLVPYLAKSDNECLDEGQAIMSDINIKGGDYLVPTPYYTIAIDQARRGGSFSDVAKMLFGLLVRTESHFDAAQKSWTYTYRIFRGSTDPATSGYYFAKDYIYFAGYHLAKDAEPYYLDFASLELDEIRSIRQAYDFSKAAHPSKDIINDFAERLLLS